MVFPDDDPEQPHKGSRYFYGEIVDVFHNIITVRVTDSTWYEWKKHSELWFSRYQVWPERSEIKQLTLF